MFKENNFEQPEEFDNELPPEAEKIPAEEKFEFKSLDEDQEEALRKAIQEARE